MKLEDRLNTALQKYAAKNGFKLTKQQVEDFCENYRDAYRSGCEDKADEVQPRLTRLEFLLQGIPLEELEETTPEPIPEQDPPIVIHIAVV